MKVDYTYSNRYLLICILVLLSLSLGNEPTSAEGELNDVSVLQQRIQALEKDVQEWKKKNMKCTQQVNIAHRKLLKQSSSSEGMEKSIKLVEEQRDALQSENDKLRLQIAELRAQLQISENRASSLEEQLEEYKNNHSQQEKRYQSLAVNDHSQFVDPILAEKQRQDAIAISEAEEAANGPKDITLFCASNPQVRIVNLDQELVQKNICLQLQLGSPELQTRLLLYCDGLVDVN